MFWQEEIDSDNATALTPILDMGFALGCPQLPVDHAANLANAIIAILPWLEDEPMAGIHCIRSATSGNGWSPPQSVMQLSRRTRLYLRIPEHRQQEVLALSNQRLQLGDDTITLGPARPRPLQSLPCLRAYHMINEVGESEPKFMQRIADELASQQIPVRKMLCGLANTVQSKTGMLHTRSVMIADLQPQESLTLQSRVIGNGRLLGCGLFVPHKGINAVNAAEK